MSARNSGSCTIESVLERLDGIVSQVRDKDTSLERSLDLLEEALDLGSRAVELVDVSEPSEEEARQAQEEH